MATMKALSHLRFESYVSLRGWTKRGAGISGAMAVRAGSHLGRWRKGVIGLLRRSVESGMHLLWAAEMLLVMCFALRMAIF